VSRKTENASFTCINCGKAVIALTNGSFRNHCPFCLWSLHVDERIGDRQSICLGKMKPIGIKYSSKKGYQVVHVCQICKIKRVNKVAENTEMSDDLDEVIKLLLISL
jgi:DNA-directed RNA polymerase subunit RPC12/RpoP